MLFESFQEFQIKNKSKLNEVDSHGQEDVKINFTTTAACIKKLKIIGGKIEPIEEKYYYSPFDIVTGANKELKGAKISLLNVNEPTISYSDIMLIPLSFITDAEQKEFFDDLSIPPDKSKKMELIGDILRILPSIELRIKIITEYVYADFAFEADLKEDIMVINNAESTTTSFRLNGKDLEADTNIIQKVKPTFSTTVEFVEVYKKLF